MFPFIAQLAALTMFGQQPDPPGQVKEGQVVNEAYLFAHMIHSDYGRLLLFGQS